MGNNCKSSKIKILKINKWVKRSNKISNSKNR